MRNLWNRWWLGNEDGIAIDVQWGRLVVARGALTQATLAQDWTIPLSETLSMELEGGSCASEGDITRALGEYVLEGNSRYTRLGVALATSSTFVAAYPQKLLYPFGDHKRIREWACDTFSFNETEHVVRIVPYQVDSAQARYVVIATKQNVVEFWKRVAAALGVELARIVPRACAIHRRGGNGENSGDRKNTIWVDMTERTPCVHRFDGAMLLDSLVVYESRGEDDVLSRIDSASRREIISGNLPDSDTIVRCVFSGPRTPEKCHQSPYLDSLLAGEVEWVSDETMGARGVLAMVEE